MQREAAINLSQTHPNSGAVSGETVRQILSCPNHNDKHYVPDFKLLLCSECCMLSSG